MIEPKKDASRWRYPDGPLGVGRNADRRLVSLERWDRMPLDHLASCVPKPVHELIKLSEREINRLHRLPWKKDFYSDRRLVFGNSDPNRYIRHDQASISQLISNPSKRLFHVRRSTRDELSHSPDPLK